MQPYLAALSVALLRSATIQSSGSATVNFRPCDPGLRNNAAALLSVNYTNLCIPCLPGWSTYNVSGAADSLQCSPGSFAPRAGSAVCSLCQAGSYASQYNSSACQPCPLNS
jgi:hypothetical protein